MLEEKLIRELVLSGAKTPDDLASFKRRVSKNHKITCPSNIKLLKAYHKSVKNGTIKKSEIIENLLKTRPVRSLSGIVNISVLTKPYPCPGKCLFCPFEKGIPKSYLSGEPAVERAKKLNYDPYRQVKLRLEMLKLQGHPTDKIELRIVGGTWSYYPKKYQEWFIKKCFDACNKTIGKNLSSSQKINETAKHRMVGLSIETRPDFINEKEIIWLRKLGATMVELGVQSIYDDVLEKNLRGHKTKETIFATKLLKDAGFKVLYQIMPNLYGSNIAKDKKMFETFFSNHDFQPDFLKIYPLALLEQTPLYKLWRDKKYKPYTQTQLLDVLKSAKKIIPYYVRIQRIARDIPSQKIITGPAKISNLRQLLSDLQKKEGWLCHCIRCREVREKYNNKEKIYLFREDYEASEGKEIFLSFESKKRSMLYSLLRLRIPSKNSFISVLKKTAIVREIHTFGQAMPLSIKKQAVQHQGLGKKLIRTAEIIARKEFNSNKIAVISSVGTRVYYRKMGYKLQDTYMIKIL